MFQQPDWIHEACLLVLNGLQNAIHYVEKLVRSDPPQPKRRAQPQEWRRFLASSVKSEYSESRVFVNMMKWSHPLGAATWRTMKVL